MSNVILWASLVFKVTSTKGATDITSEIPDVMSVVKCTFSLDEVV